MKRFLLSLAFLFAVAPIFGSTPTPTPTITWTPSPTPIASATPGTPWQQYPCALKFLGNVSYTSGVLGTSAWQITPTASSSLFLDNSGNTLPIYFEITNSLVAPLISQTAPLLMLSVPAGQQLNFNVSQYTLNRKGIYLHWINNNTNAAVIQLCQ